MPFVAIRASVREVLPWSYLVYQVLLLENAANITYNVGEYTYLYSKELASKPIRSIRYTHFGLLRRCAVAQ